MYACNTMACVFISYYYYLSLKSFTMRSILYVIAVVLIIGWLLGFFVYSATGIIHILLVLAIVSILLAVIRRGDV